MQKEADKIDSAGEERKLLFSLAAGGRGGNGEGPRRGHFFFLPTFGVISKRFLLISENLPFIARKESGDQSHRDSALVEYLNKHQGSLECRLRAQRLSVVWNKDAQV